MFTVDEDFGEDTVTLKRSPPAGIRADGGRRVRRTGVLHAEAGSSRTSEGSHSDMDREEEEEALPKTQGTLVNTFWA